MSTMLTPSQLLAANLERPLLSTVEQDEDTAVSEILGGMALLDDDAEVSPLS